MAPSVRSREDRVRAKLRHALSAAGFDEAMTLSAVDEATSTSFSPWTDAAPLASQVPVLRGADQLRRSLVPSLLAVRKTNESLSNPIIELFEIAKVYLPRAGDLPCEEPMLALTSGRPHAEVKGVIEALVAVLNPAVRLTADAAPWKLFDPAESCRFLVDGQVLGYLGTLTAEGLKGFDLRGPTVVAELKVATLIQLANLVPRYEPLPAHPAVSRDLNLVVDEAVRWADLAATVETGAGEYFEALQYRDTYRDRERLGQGKKSLLLTLILRWKQGTLTNQEADRIRDEIVALCGTKHGAALRA
jgi:phenylalanyl-tRNA synthetase beta chain